MKDQKKDKCGCGAEESEEHVCPYLEDIGGDSKTLCNCCELCEQNCAEDI